MDYIIFCIICFLQPICWPLPEISTILFGMVTIGPIPTFIISYTFIILGIFAMYKTSFILSKKFLIKFKRKKSFKKFQKYVLKNQVFAVGVLFTLPILPDEVICIGSAILGVKLKIYMIIALCAKFISIGTIVCSEYLSELINLPQYLVVSIQLVIIMIISLIFKYKKGVQNENPSKNI